MKESKGFKETEIGLIPEDWEVVRLGDIVNFKIGRTPPRKNKDYWTNGKYYWVSISDMKNPYINNTSEMVSEKAHKEIFKEKLTPAGTLLMSFKLTIGRTAILSVDSYHNEAIISIYPKENKVLKEFLFYYLPAVDYSNLQDKAIKGNTLNTSKLIKIPIPLPPLEEQKAIADILSTIQNAIEKTEKVINATKQLKKSMMKHLFTYGAVAVEEIDKVKLKESEIGLIPENWEVVRLENVMEGFTPNKKLKQSDYKAIGKFPVIDQGQEYVAGFYDDETMVFDKDLPVILFGDHTRIIKYVDFPFICGADGLKIIIPKENLHRKYFYYALLNLNIPSRGYNRHFKILKEKLIPLPPLDEQQKIANILTTIDQKIQAEEKKKVALRSLFKTLLRQLMTGKIRVRYPS
jgi:Restriction endonuclease S subunits